MGPVVVVPVAPVGDKDLGFEQTVKLFDREQRVPPAAPVGLDSTQRFSR